MMRNKITLFLISIFFSNLVFAQLVPVEKARLAAKNLMIARSKDSNAKAGNINFSDEISIKYQGKTVLYVFNISGSKGYVITSSEKQVFPILSYSYSGRFDMNDPKMPPAYKNWILNYQKAIKNIIDNKLTNKQSALAWNKFIYGVKADKEIMAVGPLLDPIAWDQDKYYNDFCPQDNLAGPQYGNRCPTGCVATAMAQVMRFWMYPSKGVGQHSYTPATHPGYGMQMANFGTTTYNWANMPASVTSVDTNVATVLFHAGVSVDMDYDPAGSGAATSDARDALVNNFRYSTDAVYMDKASMADSAWKAMLKSDLDLHRVVLYAGHDTAASGGGHAFICDGYEGALNDHFHFNWGWGGAYNCYNYLTNLTTDQTGTGGGNGVYTNAQKAIFHIHPASDSYPHADFIGTPTTIPKDGTVSFTDLSTTPTGTTFKSRKWYFNGGTPDTSSLANPIIAYHDTGKYSVKLVVLNYQGGDSLTKNLYINVVPPSIVKPKARFVADRCNFFVGDSINFTDLSQNTPLFWTWSFTGGTPATSTLQNPTNIKYLLQGTYAVKLKVSNTLGKDSLTKTYYIHVLTNEGTLPPIADFNAGPRLLTVGNTVNFADSSKNIPVSWSWSFQNGTPSTSTLQNPVGILYSQAGMNNVTLSVTNANGNSTITKTQYIYVSSSQVQSYCGDTLSNVAQHEPITYYPIATTGFVPGVNLKSKIYAEKFDSYTFSEVDRLLVSIAKKKQINPNSGSYVIFTILDCTSSGLPSITELATKKIFLSAINPNLYNPITFNPPATLHGPFFVGVNFSYISPGDTLILNMAANRISGYNTLYAKSGSVWKTCKDVFGYSSSLDIQIIPCLTSVNELKVDEKINIYPNPASDQFIIDLGEGSSYETSVKIYDLMGKIIDINPVRINDNQFQINTEKLSSGLYLLNINKGNRVVSRKISVIR